MPESPPSTGLLGWDVLAAADAIIDADRWCLDVGGPRPDGGGPDPQRTEVPLAPSRDGPTVEARCGGRVWKLCINSQAMGISVAAAEVDPSWVLGISVHGDGDPSSDGWWPMVTAPAFTVGGAVDPAPYLLRASGIGFGCRSAVGWIGIEWLRRHRAVIVCATRRLCVPPAPEEPAVGPVRVTLPFDYTRLHCPAIHAVVDGVPLLLMVDSGLDVSQIDPHAAERMPTAWRLDGFTKGDLGAFGNPQRMIRPERFTVGGITMRRPILCAQANRIGGIDGVIGADLLMRWRAIIDFANGTLTLRDPAGRLSPLPAAGALRWTSAPTGHLVVGGFCGLFPMAWLIDTGSMTCVMDSGTRGSKPRLLEVDEEFLLANRAVQNPGWLWSMDLSALTAVYPSGSNRGIIGCDLLVREQAALDYGTRTLELGMLAAVARESYGLRVAP